MDLKGKCVLLGVSGGIAAYKMANVASALRKLGADVEVTLELPESYVLGSDPEVYAVYTVHGGEKQEMCIRDRTMGVDEPHAVGKDRLVDAAYAAANFPLPVVTVDLGTATTFNVVEDVYKRQSLPSLGWKVMPPQQLAVDFCRI